jgi:hypothetical protein
MDSSVNFIHLFRPNHAGAAAKNATMGPLAGIELAVPSQGSTKSFTKSFNIISIE